jgi:orotate phosphoribosyltransferase
MDTKSFSVSLAKNPLISMNVIPGHFTTSNNHISHYLDMSDMKSNALIARDIARELAVPYLANTPVETIVCMERTDVIGAYLAEELLQNGTAVNNDGGEIRVVTPVSNQYMNLIFPGSTIDWIANKYVLLLVASINGGRTVKSALECLSYYGGTVVGISTLFLASTDKQWENVNTLFTADDVPGYHLRTPSECEMCQAGLKLDAIVSSDGYTII